MPTGFDGMHAFTTVIVVLIAIVVVVMIGTVVYRGTRMARRGQNPLTLPEDLAYRANRSAALAPTRSKADRLAELDAMAADGSISPAERDAARARILAE